MVTGKLFFDIYFILPNIHFYLLANVLLLVGILLTFTDAFPGKEGGMWDTGVGRSSSV
jgi:hypothetical protein